MDTQVVATIALVMFCLCLKINTCVARNIEDQQFVGEMLLDEMFVEGKNNDDQTNNIIKTITNEETPVARTRYSCFPWIFNPGNYLSYCCLLSHVTKYR